MADGAFVISCDSPPEAIPRRGPCSPPWPSRRRTPRRRDRSWRHHRRLRIRSLPDPAAPHHRTWRRARCCRWKPEGDAAKPGPPPPTGTIGQPPVDFAGGPVSRGGRVGFPGNRSVSGTPLTQANGTAELIRNQQARSVGDVLANCAFLYGFPPPEAPWASPTSPRPGRAAWTASRPIRGSISTCSARRPRASACWRA